MHYALGFRIARTVTFEGGNETPSVILYPENGNEKVGSQPIFSWRTTGVDTGEFRVYLGESQAQMPLVGTTARN